LKEKTVMFSTIAGAIVNLIANFLLIPRFGVIGAAVGTVFAEVLVLIVQFTALKKNMSEAFRSIKYSKILFALCAACLAGSWPLWSGMSNFMTLVVSTVLFFGVYAAVLFLAKEPFVTEISGQMIAKIKSRMKKN
jgi:O-antigen/teichoic acid export membrane protein